ncbi:hypothetical protein AB4289_15395 [Vibrio cyclitrophicus]
MGITATVPTMLGHKKNIYIRINNIASNNHGELTTALFRGYESKASFEAGAHYIYEESFKYMADVGRDLWNQSYEAYKEQALYPDIQDCF